MDDSRNTVAGRTCPQCNANADVGRIFCANCGATIQIPIVLSPSGGEDGDLPSKNISSMKRTVLMVIKGLATVAAWSSGFVHCERVRKFFCLSRPLLFSYFAMYY